MTPRLTVEQIQTVFVKALLSESFERHGSRRGTWDVSRDCENPVPVSLASRATGEFRNVTKFGVKSVPGIELNLLTPCRRCRVCLAKKARLWTWRAMNELECAERTWFGTLTTSPDTDVWIDHVCSTRKRDFWMLPQSKKFAEQALVLGTEVTKYLKRIRKNSGCQFRYLLVTETHDSRKTSPEKQGRPHMHILLHEFAGQPIPKRILDANWHHGHCQFRLTAGSKVAWYVSKYITKASDARVRASLGYGMRLSAEEEILSQSYRR